MLEALRDTGFSGFNEKQKTLIAINDCQKKIFNFTQEEKLDAIRNLLLEPTVRELLLQGPLNRQAIFTAPVSVLSHDMNYNMLRKFTLLYIYIYIGQKKRSGSFYWRAQVGIFRKGVSR